MKKMYSAPPCVVPPQYGSSANAVPIELPGMMHLSAGLPAIVAAHCVYATYDPPCMQIFPFDQGCLVIHASASLPSLGSSTIGSQTPSDLCLGSMNDVPRVAWNTSAYPRAV